ncbi:hypothetical protein ABE945_08520 [Enterococcus gilvus]|uniref:hypothetical protein n=1 Tax=Enterococcus gilvus TaxID=160453 RepID=UPI003D6A6B8D
MDTASVLEDISTVRVTDLIEQSTPQGEKAFSRESFPGVNSRTSHKHQATKELLNYQRTRE